MENEKEELKKTISNSIKELIEKMGIDCDIEEKALIQDETDSIAFNIKTKESNYLIGQYGINLQALQHIARVIVRKKTDSRANFVLDVNSYRQEKNESILSLAKSMAEQSILEKRAMVLRPMSPYERRLVHMELSKNLEIKTESTGEGEDRRIVIKPANLV